MMSDNTMPKRIFAGHGILGGGQQWFEAERVHFGHTTEYIRADVVAKQLAERDAKIISFQTRVTELRHDLNMVIDQRNAANARIAELEAAQALVSVKERLPEDDEVLVYEKDQWGYDIWGVDSYSPIQRRWLNDATPTHWMPLPPPPVTP